MQKYRLKGTSGAVINQLFELGEHFLIGRSDDCHLRIDSEDVEARHCELIVTEKGVMVVDLGSASGTLLNGERISGAAMNSGDELRVGGCRFLLQAPGLRPDRVLTDEAVTARRKVWPWVILTAVVAGAALLAWRQGWLSGLLG